MAASHSNYIERKEVWIFSFFLVEGECKIFLKLRIGVLLFVCSEADKALIFAV